MKDIKTKKTILLIIFVASIITIVGTVSYAFFSASAIKNDQTGSLQIGTINVRFADNDDSLLANKISFGGSVTKKFTIENYGTLDATIRIDWVDIINTYIQGSLTYKLSYSTSEDGEYTDVITNRNVPVSETAKTLTLAESLNIPAKTTYYFNLVTTLNYLEDIDQTADLTAMFTTKFKASDISVLSDENLMITRLIGDFYTEGLESSLSYESIWAHSSDIKKLSLKTKLAPKMMPIIYMIYLGSNLKA